MNGELHIVTGAFGYSGRYIAARLLKEGHHVLSVETDGWASAKPASRV